MKRAKKRQEICSVDPRVDSQDQGQNDLLQD